MVDAGGVFVIEAGEGVQQQGQVFGRGGHKACLVEAGGEGDHAPARDAAIGGFNTADAAETGGLADGTAGVGGCCRWCQTGGNRSCGTA